MIRMNTYYILDRLAVEVTCSHGSGDGASHLLIREWHRAVDGPTEVAAALADTMALLYEGVRTDAIEMTDDCGR